MPWKPRCRGFPSAEYRQTPEWLTGGKLSVHATSDPAGQHSTSLPPFTSGMEVKNVMLDQSGVPLDGDGPHEVGRTPAVLLGNWNSTNPGPDTSPRDSGFGDDFLGFHESPHGVAVVHSGEEPARDDDGMYDSDVDLGDEEDEEDEDEIMDEPSGVIELLATRMDDNLIAFRADDIWELNALGDLETQCMAIRDDPLFQEEAIESDSVGERLLGTWSIKEITHEDDAPLEDNLDNVLGWATIVDEQHLKAHEPLA
ncbi:hypothetical protein DFJ74DRAFT_774369 [Hyaloraphidium curvatum]|nr:hypothetical protein DFJ74DRAFT_774369 [Hyaloraphidium curvatum]